MTDEDMHALYVISIAAELAGMHPQTLRMYERRGLVQPDRTPGGSRRYSDLDVERLRKIHFLTETGMNLEGVRRVLELEDEVEQLRREVEALRAELSRVQVQYSGEMVPPSQVKGFPTYKSRRS